MKEMTEIRLENLTKIAATFKNQRELADAIGESYGYVNQLLRGKRGIGERKAREIEEALKMQRGSLDVYELNVDSEDTIIATVDPVTVTPEELGIINLLRDLTSIQRKKLLESAKEFKSENRIAFSELGHRYGNQNHAHA